MTGWRPRDALDLDPMTVSSWSRAGQVPTASLGADVVDREPSVLIVGGNSRHSRRFDEAPRFVIPEARTRWSGSDDLVGLGRNGRPQRE